MKMGWLLGLALAALCLPAMALGESWADFVKRAETKMEGASGVVAIEAQEPVAAYAAEPYEDSGDMEDDGARDWRMPEDVPLVVPKGVTLVLSGGEYAGLLLGGGQVELRGVTVSGEAGQPAICLDEVSSAKDMTLRLTLDAQTLVTGQDAPALANVPGNRQAWDLTIQNAGKVSGEGEVAAVELQFWSDKNAAMLLHNIGEIAGREGVFIYTGPPTAYRIAVRNEGTITGQTFGMALTDIGEKKANYIQVLNEAGGVIESEGSGSAAVCFNGLGKATCQLVNEGTLRGYHPLQLGYALGSYQPLEFLGDGEFITTGSATVQVRLNQEGAEAAVLDEAALAAEAEALLADGGLSTLPEYTTIGVSLAAEVDGEALQGLPQVLVTSPGREITPISWAEFRSRAASVAKQASGEAFLYLPGPVEAYAPDDKPLVVEAGPRLVVRGGQFSGMLLGAGELELRGVTVETAEADWPAIYIENQGKEIDLTLLLDADTVVRATGTGAAALGAVEAAAQSLTLSVTNRGRMESVQGDGVLVQPKMTGEQDATIFFANHGDIQGAGTGLTLSADTVLGTADVSLHNAGSITGQSGPGAWVRSVSEDAPVLAEVDNAAEGGIRSEEKAGLVLEIAESTMEGNYYDSSALVRNAGTITGGPTAFEARTVEAHPVLLQLRGTGAWQSEAGGPAMTAALVQDDGEEPVGQEFYEANSTAWVNLAGRAYLPEDFDISVHLRYLQDEEAEPRELYAKTVYGGGQGMPDATLEAANYNLPIFLKYDGDGTITLPEIRDDALLLKRVSDYELRADGTIWFLVGDKWKEETDYQRYFVEEDAPVTQFQRGGAIYTDGSPNWLFTYFVQHERKSAFPDLTIEEFYVYAELSLYRKYLQSLYPGASLGVERDSDGIYHTTLAVGDQSITMPETLPPEVFPGFWDYGDEPYDYQMYVESGGKVYINMDYAQYDVLMMVAIMDGNQPNVKLLAAE